MAKKSKRSSKKKKVGNDKQKEENQAFSAAFSPASPNDQEGSPQSLYSRYKAATERFKQTLRSLVPRHIWATNVVQDFVDAADYIRDNQVVIEKQLLADLRLAINVRNKYCKHFVEGGMDDEGHAYFVAVLNYCLVTLKPCLTQDGDEGGQKKGKQQQNGKDEEETKVVNRFASLQIEDDGEDSDDDQEDQEETEPSHVNRPVEPAKHYSSACLFEVPDTAQAVQFFEYMDIHMAFMVRMLNTIKETMSMMDRGELPPDYDLCGELLAFGSTFIVGLKSIRQAEDALRAENPHLDTPYRIIACSCLAPVINIVKNAILDYSPVSQKFQPHMANNFVADIVKIMMRKGNFQEVDESAVKFSKYWRLSDHRTGKMRYLANIAAKIVMRQTMTAFESDQYKQTGQDYLSENMADYDDREVWLEDMRFLSGDSSILNTMKILDLWASMMLSEDASESDMYRAQQGGFDLRFDENNRPLSKIRHDTDGLLPMFMPLLAQGWQSENMRKVFKERELLPLISIFKDCIFEHKGKRISFACGFGFHAILTSILAIQGDSHLAKIAQVGESTCEMFFAQVHHEQQVISSFLGDEKAKRCISFALEAEELQQINEDNDEEDMRWRPLALWNPVCAGMFLAYTTFGLSLGVGSPMMDWANTRIVLHLYHALRELDYVTDNLPIVSTIHDYFSSVKSVWNGWDEKPVQGQFVYRFNLSLGLDHKCAMYRRKLAEFSANGGEKPEKPKNLSFRRNRTTGCIKAEEFATSYKRACLHDMQGTEEVPAHLLRKDVGAKMGRIIEEDIKYFRLMTALFDDMPILKLNLLAVAGAFNEFLFNLFPPGVEDESNGIRHLAIMSGMRPPDPDTCRKTDIYQRTEEALALLDHIKPEDNSEYLSDLASQFECFFGEKLDLGRVVMH